MLKGLNMSQRIEFSSVTDTSDPKTIFVLRPLSGEEQENFKDAEGNKLKLSGTKIYDFLSTAVVEIKNFDIAGSVREQLNTITDSNILAELIREAANLSQMLKDDQKNS